MANRTPTAGGFFLFVAVTIGLVWGAATGQAMRGVLIGTAVGIALALVTWILDRRRRG
jgi:UDP-N-acetylmuramyl pentapeptide phosphotransferase/UDP-N-acetylglucosamine-1-phosphate transferase